jgi:protein-S-isoprenylcysteine O-methyltransferase Ste14
MPGLSIYLWACLHRNGGALILPRSVEDLHKLAIPLPTARAVVYCLGWLALQIALHLVVPARTVTGMPQRDGRRLQYRLNGWTTLWISQALLIGLFATGVLPLTAIYDELGGLITTATLLAVVFGLFLYFYGYRSRHKEWRTGHRIYDFFLGTSLNPRIGRFDLKVFFESHIGMGCWAVLLVGMAAAQYGKLGTLTTPMILTCVLQMIYIADFFFFESTLLGMWDILYENYGFMLVHAFLVWMPFNFSLQAQFLVTRSTSLPTWEAVAIGVLFLLGYYIFRTANLQKFRFRTDPSALIWGKPPTYIKTARGTHLLTSGWWGLSRHANYLGDLMMALAMCLPCGVSYVVPFFYFIYFAPLLIDRERRDHTACHEKYGRDWEEYCRRVPWRIVPRVY